MICRCEGEKNSDTLGASWEETRTVVIKGTAAECESRVIGRIESQSVRKV